MSLTRELGFVGMVGIIDPLRAEARNAVRTALRAGIDVRMITGDHAVTAQSVGATLGLGPGAVNDAAALEQADIGVALGSGSTVSRQAARLVLGDDDVGTLVHAVGLGRRSYGRVVSYLRYQMTQLLALVLLFVTATVFDINSGVAMTPLMVLYLTVFLAVLPVVVITLDPADPEPMKRPPRDLAVPITNGPAVTRWLLYGAVLFLAALVPLVAGPDRPGTATPSASMTMCYVVIGLGTVFSGLVMRRDPASGLIPPLLAAVTCSAIAFVLLLLSTELGFLQRGLHTQELTVLQWLACVGLAAVLPSVVEVDKEVRRRRLRPAAAEPVSAVVAPTRAAVPGAG
jgi:Ca2+-transporting ATPase